MLIDGRSAPQIGSCRVAKQGFWGLRWSRVHLCLRQMRSCLRTPQTGWAPQSQAQSTGHTLNAYAGYATAFQSDVSDWFASSARPSSPYYVLTLPVQRRFFLFVYSSFLSFKRLYLLSVCPVRLTLLLFIFLPVSPSSFSVRYCHRLPSLHLPLFQWRSHGS